MLGGRPRLDRTSRPRASISVLSSLYLTLYCLAKAVTSPYLTPPSLQASRSARFAEAIWLSRASCFCLALAIDACNFAAASDSTILVYALMFFFRLKSGERGGMAGCGAAARTTALATLETKMRGFEGCLGAAFAAFLGGGAGLGERARLERKMGLAERVEEGMWRA